VVFGGDFCQTLPMVFKETHQQVVAVSLCRENLWEHIKFLHLRQNMHLCKKAKLQARIKPTALCSAIEKENSIESPLDLLYYIYNYCHDYVFCLPQFSCLSAVTIL